MGTAEVDVFDVKQQEAKGTIKMVAPKEPGASPFFIYSFRDATCLVYRLFVSLVRDVQGARLHSVNCRAWNQCRGHWYIRSGCIRVVVANF